MNSDFSQEVPCPPPTASLEDGLRAVHQRLGANMRELWNRDLPFQELISDRWNRAASLGFGVGSSIYESAYIFGKVRVGPHSWIGPSVILDGSGGLSIGEYCSISSGVQMYSHDTVEWALTGGKANYRYAPVSVEDRCFIGSGAIVLAGVTVGMQSVIGAGSVVTHDIPPRSVAWGAPARIHGHVIIDGDTARLEMSATVTNLEN